MIRFLRNNQQLFILFIFLYSLVAVFSVYFTQSASRFSPSPFYLPFLAGIFQEVLEHNTISFLITFLDWLILIFAGFYLVRIGINYLIISQRSQFSALFFIAICSFGFRQELYSGAGIAALFLLIALDRVIGSMDVRGRSYRFVDGGIIIALGSLFYFNMIFLIPFLWLAQFLLRPASWREILYTLLGLCLPLLYLISGYFIFDRSFGQLTDQILSWITLRKTITPGWPFLAGIGFYLVMMLIGTVFALRKFAATKIQSRKLYQLLFFLFINLILIILLVPSTGVEIMFLLAIPSSVLLSIYFTECRYSIINNLILFILLLIPLLLNIFGDILVQQ